MKQSFARETASALTGTTGIPISVPVAIVPGGPASHRVAALYRAPLAYPRGPRQIDVCTAGATYKGSYWSGLEGADLPRYTDAALAAGRAVLAYDRLGTGQSTRPASDEVTVESDAFVLQQLIAWARDGHDEVNVLGHSLGSLIAITAAGRWPAGPSRLILTGVRHVMNTDAMDLVLGSMYPAIEDRRFSATGMDRGWWTTRPGSRAALFHAPGADPGIVALDEEAKDVYASPNYLAGMTLVTDPPGTNVSGKITAPVLVINGDQDVFFCTGAAACASTEEMTRGEEPYYRAAKSFTAHLIPAGHDLNLDPSGSPLTFKLIGDWITSTPAQ